MSNMGNSYAGNFGSWFTAALGVTSLDYLGLQTAQGLRETTASRRSLLKLQIAKSRDAYKSQATSTDAIATCLC